MLAANVFLLLAFYYLLKTVREALISRGRRRGEELRRTAARGCSAGFHSATRAWPPGVTLKLINSRSSLRHTSSITWRRRGMQIGRRVLPLDWRLQPRHARAVVGTRRDVYDVERGKRLFPIVGAERRSARGPGQP